MHKKIIWVLTILAGCSPVIEKHGFENIRESSQKIVIAKDTCDSVRKKLGPPNTTACDANKVWYYMSVTQEIRAFLPPKIKEKLMLKIVFDSKGYVTSKDVIDHYGRPIVLVKDKTPTEGVREGYLQDIVGNMKKFGSQYDKK